MYDPESIKHPDSCIYLLSKGPKDLWKCIVFIRIDPGYDTPAMPRLRHICITLSLLNKKSFERSGRYEILTQYKVGIFVGLLIIVIVGSSLSSRTR